MHVVTGKTPQHLDNKPSTNRYHFRSRTVWARKTFDIFVPPGEEADAWYLTFGKTNPATLQYEYGHDDKGRLDETLNMSGPPRATD